MPARPRLLAAALGTAVVLGAAGVCACGTASSSGTGAYASSPAPTSPAHPCGRTAKGRGYRHVVWIVMENHAPSQALGGAYLRRLAPRCGLATNYRAVTHPSLPNYLAMTSGSTHGVGDDAGPDAHPIRGPSLFSQLGPRGWRTLQEGMPSPCRLGDTGRYAVKHNPAAYYTSVRAACRARDIPLRAPVDISARFTFVTPDLCDDTHDCSTATGDRWLRGFVPRLLTSPQYRAGHTAIFITWDENDGSAGNRVATLVLSPSTRPGTRSPRAFGHFSLLRTTETLLGVRTHLGGAAHAADMRAAFGL